MLEKRCNRCHKIKPIEEFHPDADKKDGLRTICKICTREFQNNKLKNSPEGLYYKARKEDRERRTWNGRCQQCSEPKLPHNLLCLKHWFIQVANVRLGRGTVADGKAMEDILIAQNYTCPYSGKKLVPGVNCWLDHKLPRSRFPEYDHDISNFQWVDEMVNRSKQDMTEEEFINFCKSITNYWEIAHADRY